MIAGERLPTLRGKRVDLRWLEERDVPALFDVFSNPDVMRYWSCLPFTEHGQARELLRAIQDAFQAKTLFQWGVALRDGDGIIGTCTLSSVDASNGRAELGYALSRAHWGSGLMTEALVMLLDFSFGTLGLRRLEADVDPENAASIRVLERFGFQREGHLRERWFVGGQAQDALYYGLLRREWESRRT